MNALQITVIEIKVLLLFDIRIQPIHLPRKIKISINCLINNEMIALFLVMMSCSLFVFLCSIDIIDDSTLNFLIIINIIIGDNGRGGLVQMVQCALFVGVMYRFSMEGKTH